MSMQVSDAIAGILCFCLMLSLTLIHIFSDREHCGLYLIPEPIRWGLMLSAGALLFRAVDFGRLAVEPFSAVQVAGHIDFPGLVASAFLAGTFGMCAIALGRRWYLRRHATGIGFPFGIGISQMRRR